MKRNGSKSVVSVIAAAVIALLAAGCVTVPSGAFTQDQVKSKGCLGRDRFVVPIRRRYGLSS